MFTAVATWLKQGGSYQRGLSLLTDHGTADADTLDFLDLGETTVTRELLRKELQHILDEAVERTQRAAEKETLRVYAPIAHEKEELVRDMRDPRSDGYAGKELTPAQREVHDGIKRDLKERDYLRHRLELHPSDKDRYRDAMRIVEVDDAIQGAYHRLDTWLKFGTDPDAGSNIPQATLLDKSKELRNIKTYLSRHKTGARVLSDERLAEYKQRVETLERELAPQ